ncbi:hypothetical protein BFV98_24165 [Micromonospora sp. WMMB235]|nr:hypothetical protein BFV98_24165 [Micromonospora sp. WMMB235]
MGRLPWLALLFLRAFFLRAFFAMLCLLVLVTVPSAAGRGGGRGAALRARRWPTRTMLVPSPAVGARRGGSRAAVVRGPA